MRFQIGERVIYSTKRVERDAGEIVAIEGDWYTIKWDSGSHELRDRTIFIDRECEPEYEL